MEEKILCSLIKESEPIIYSIIKKYSVYCNAEDLYQAGCIGVIKAYKKYKDNLNSKFSSYAYKYIFGEIISFIKKDRNIQISDDAYSIYKRYLKIKDLLFIKCEREATIKEISEVMEIDEHRLVNIIESVAFTSNIENDEIYFDHNVDDIDSKIMINEEISLLNQFDKSIINCRYYLGYNQSETAKILGVSQAMISRKETLILKKIKSNIC